MRREAAASIVPELFRAAQVAADTLEILRPYASEEEFKMFSAAIGKVVFAITDVIEPIIVEHPELNPK